MSARNTKTTLAAVKLTVFTVASLLVTGMLAMIMGHFAIGGRTTYQALFSSASELKSGDDVRIAGVSVGDVKSVDIYHRTEALVTFAVDSSVPMTTATKAEVRYLNLVGDRYLALDQGTPGAPALKPGGEIPMSQTVPALNLTELFNGFQPLFQALTPHDVNELSMNLVQVLQGEGGTIEALLARTASLTNGLADRDQLVGQVVDNLSSTLDLVDSRHQQLTALLRQLRGWTGHLAADRVQIGDSLQSISGLTTQVAGLIGGVRPYVKADVAQIRRMMAILNRPANRALLADTLRRLPTTLRRQARIGSFGSWYNYYLCDFTGTVVLPKIQDLLPASVLNDPVLAQLLAPIDQARIQLQDEINKNMTVHSIAPRCDG